MDDRYVYHNLIGASREINATEYRRKFTPVSKNADGIPIHLEEEAEKRGLILARSYEALYDRNKQAIKNAGVEFSQMLRADDGGIVAVNHASVMVVPPLARALEQGDNPLWAVISLHWVRAHKEHEWVFCHLCEAVHAYYSVSGIRAQLGLEVENHFDDMKDYLMEALYQYDHRHC